MADARENLKNDDNTGILRSTLEEGAPNLSKSYVNDGRLAASEINKSTSEIFIENESSADLPPGPMPSNPLHLTAVIPPTPSIIQPTALLHPPPLPIVPTISAPPTISALPVHAGPMQAIMPGAMGGPALYMMPPGAVDVTGSVIDPSLFEVKRCTIHPKPQLNCKYCRKYKSAVVSSCSSTDFSNQVAVPCCLVFSLQHQQARLAKQREAMQIDRDQDDGDNVLEM